MNPIIKVTDVPLHVFLAYPNALFGEIYPKDAFYLRTSAAKAYQLAVKLFKEKGFDLIGIDAY